MRILAVPLVPLLLVLSGLVPFLSGAVLAWVLPSGDRLLVLSGQALIVYGALILSFLGGVRWGAEINAQGSGGTPRATILNMSVIGSLAGWGLVLWTFASAGADWRIMAAAGVTHVLHGFWDREGAALPIWYRRLRFPAALAASACLFAAAGAYWLR